MDPYVEKVVDGAQEQMARASDAEGLDSTIFYGHQALVTMLTGVLSELAEIRELLKRER